MHGGTSARLAGWGAAGGGALLGNWTITNVVLYSAVTNVMLVTGRETSWHPSWAGSTTFNDTLTVIFPSLSVPRAKSNTPMQTRASPRARFYRVVASKATG
jgi:hypothetical protein